MRREDDCASYFGSMFGIICTLFIIAMLFANIYSPSGPLSKTQATQDISRSPQPATN